MLLAPKRLTNIALKRGKQVAMQTARNASQQLDFGEAATTLAIAVLVERIHGLPPEDKEDLFEVSKILYKAIADQNEEEEEAAIKAYREILDQRKGRVVELTVDDGPVGMDGWLSYVSARIKKAREDAGLTQQQLEVATGLPQSHISRLENGVHSPSSATLQKIAAATNKPLSYFDPSGEADA
jgi:DNA-binding XRE family transcriptional regulator